jgi:predicted Zn-dependent protease
MTISTWRHTHKPTRSLLSLPSLTSRLVTGRPVLAQDQMHDIAQRIMAMTMSPDVRVAITHTARVATRIAGGQVLTSDDGDTIQISVHLGDGEATTSFLTNQVDPQVLRAMVQACEAANSDLIREKEYARPPQPLVQDVYAPVHLWHPETIEAMRISRATVLPPLLLPIRKAGLTAAGFVGLIARSNFYNDRSGLTAYYEETDCEVTVTAYGDKGQSGWGGQAARKWSDVDLAFVTANAVTTAERSQHPVAIEPGRRTAILGAAAMGHIARAMIYQFSDGGLNGFLRDRRGYGWGERYFDPRITIRSDPADPAGGYCPYFNGPYATPATTWVERGRLKNLRAEFGLKGKPYVDWPYSMRIGSDAGGTMSVEQMIAQCEEGIFVNRLSGVEVVDYRTGLVSGVTRDGCFLIKHGKIQKAVKNFRFLDSPFFFLNKLEAIGESIRVALGFILPTRFEQPEKFHWPLPPLIVPPVMVRDFNFSALVDAV